MISRNFLCLILTLILTLVFSNILMAQDTTDAAKAYFAWREKISSQKNLAGSFDHHAVAFAVSRYGDAGVTVDISIGVSPATVELKEMEFVVRPLIISDQSGQSILEETGRVNSVKSPRLTGLVVPESGIIASPKLVAKVPAGTKAVKVEVKGFGDQLMTVTIPLRDRPATAVLGRGENCTSSNSLSECLWFTGSCGPGGGDCGGRLLCAGCNNGSPNLNCVSCTMGCTGGGECTPSTEAPQGCSISQ